LNQFSFGNTDAKFDRIDSKAICVVACEPNEKTLAVFGQNFFDSVVSRPATVSNEWRALRTAIWARFWFHSDERHFA
jgi:hypothetical protein